MQRQAELKQGDVEADDRQAGHHQPRPASSGLILESLEKWNFRDQA